MRDNRSAIKLIKARHTSPKSARTATFEEGSNLYAAFPLSIGYRLILTSNIWTERNLVNSTIGTLIDVV